MEQILKQNQSNKSAMKKLSPQANYQSLSISHDTEEQKLKKAKNINQSSISKPYIKANFPDKILFTGKNQVRKQCDTQQVNQRVSSGRGYPRSLQNNKKLKEFMKFVNTHKSNAKILKQSPYCRYPLKNHIISQLCQKRNNNIKKIENHHKSQIKQIEPLNSNISSTNLKSQKNLSQSTDKDDKYIVVSLKNMYTKYIESRLKKQNKNSKKNDAFALNSRNLAIQISLTKCTDSSNKICAQKIKKELQKIGCMDPYQINCIIGFQIYEIVKKNNASFSLETANYLLSIGMLSPNCYYPDQQSNIIFKMRPLMLKVSNLAAAIVFSKVSSSNHHNSLAIGNQPSNRSRYRSKESNLKQFSFKLNDFKVVQCLGSGGFSTVYLVYGLFNNKYYAMKLIDKKFILETQRDAIITSERSILQKLSCGNKQQSEQCSFITKLQFAFQTLNHFIFLVEYCPGGQLFNRLKKVKKMTEDQARFYFLQILVGLDYIHKHDIIYRDLKPENLLIDQQGHIKIADFGLSKQITDKKSLSYSFCGSPEYMAPEMLTKAGHNHLLDYYCLGALLYELVIGIPPYYSLNQEEIYESILTEQLSFPNNVELSHELKSLLISLLNKQSRQRLGSLCGIKEIMAHPWVGRIKKQKILRRQLQPPYIPNLQQFNFDLQDVKNNLDDIIKLLDEDRKSKSFEEFFSDDFNYWNQKQVDELLTKISKNRQTRNPQQYSLKKSESMRCQTFRAASKNPLLPLSKGRLNLSSNRGQQKGLLELLNNRSLDRISRHSKQKQGKDTVKIKITLLKDAKSLQKSKSRRLMQRDIYLGTNPLNPKKKQLQGVKRVRANKLR